MSDYLSNTQVVHAVSETTVEVLGTSERVSSSMLDILMAQTTGAMMNQAVTTQQSARTSSQASLTSTCAKILRTPTQRIPPPSEPTPGPVSPLASQGQTGLSISCNFSQAQAALGALNQDFQEARNNRQNAQALLRNLAALATSDTPTK